jgi:hypothetical protein
MPSAPLAYVADGSTAGMGTPEARTTRVSLQSREQRVDQ